MAKRYFSDKLVKWYLRSKRDLPWRETKNPYFIWLSEVILQQTRVSQGLPYYRKFIDRFPTVESLARASEQEVLRLWQGLGYYTRARNLHRCAAVVHQNHSGKFPSTYKQLKDLPGIGDYTAAAIASIAFQEPVAVVDGNVFRVLARVFGIEKDIRSLEAKEQFFQLANEVLDPKHPDLHNQAIMEFGALHCTPVLPHCEDCIFQKTCFANLHGLQHVLPVKSPLKTTRKRYFYYFVLFHNNRIMLKKREEKDIWQGLFDFYLVERKVKTSVEKLIKEDVYLQNLKIEDKETTEFYKHVLSHQVIHSKFIIIQLNEFKNMPFIKFYSKRQIDKLPKPALISRFLNDYSIL